jgi:hypothetical protein
VKRINKLGGVSSELPSGRGRRCGSSPSKLPCPMLPRVLTLLSSPASARIDSILCYLIE